MEISCLIYTLGSEQRWTDDFGYYKGSCKPAGKAESSEEGINFSIIRVMKF